MTGTVSAGGGAVEAGAEAEAGTGGVDEAGAAVEIGTGAETIDMTVVETAAGTGEAGAETGGGVCHGCWNSGWPLLLFLSLFRLGGKRFLNQNVTHQYPKTLSTSLDAS
jgi:hypothetical protein